MKDAHVQHTAETLAFRGLQRWIARRPHDALAPCGRRLGRLAHRLLRAKRRLALDNVGRVFPELVPEARRRVVKRCFEHFGVYFLQVVSVARLDEDDLLSRFEVTGLEHLEAALNGPRGCFLTTGHYGSWELAMFPLARWATQRQRAFHAVARPLDNPRIDDALKASRQRLGVEIIDKVGAAHRMLNAYRQGGLVAIVIDQHVRETAGIQVPFFGEPAWTSPVLATLSLRTGAPVVPFTCVPAGAKGRYRLTLHPAIEPEGEGAEAEHEMTKRYLQAVEHDIRQQPEYWLWMHRRWRA